jgi:hypothetical protein
MSNETKRQKMSTWDDACNGLIDASDENECKLIISKLENLLKKATQRKDMLEKESRESGMNYEGEDGVECDCGNVFEPEGDDAATCDFCDKEQCNDCVVYCQRCEKHMFMCSECMKACTACDENFCKDITEFCPYCDGGMNYEGEDGVRCDCGNVFEPEGDDAATCDFCDKEQCNDCVVYCPYCQRCEKHMFMCSECMKACTACDENFCKECITECCTCSEPYCNGDGKECALVTVGYRGEQSCVYCVEPR